MKNKLMTMLLAACAMLGAWADTHDKVQLWEGGPYWATTNVGAEKPEDYGYYFWWGDTTGYRPSGTTFDFRFYYDNTVISTYGKSDSQLKSEGWLTDDGVLAPEHDAAHVLWGGKWRMPTFQELLDLIDNCDWSPTTMNGVDGFEVRGRGGYASASIFLPFAGDGAETSVYNSGSRGYYWSSSSIPESSNYFSSWGLFFESGSGTSDDYRYYGQSVRPIQDAPATPSSDLYCVIDLSGGPEAESYPVTYLSKAPDGGWTDEYKTTKLVMRRIDPGTFMMGPNEYEYHKWQSQWENGSFFRCYESDPRQVTITEPFYIGVFEVTQKQYELVTGATPSDYSGDTRPVNKVSWNDIRGNSSTYNWPSSTEVASSSFVGKIRAKTGIDTFDLPTEAKWEYACRAGTTTSFNDGHNLTNFSVDPGLNQLGHYQFTASGGLSARGASVVGSFLPNAWGLYDMHGNVNEWVLDWSSYGNPDTAVVDPVGPSSGSRRNTRGGGWNTAAHNCRSGFSIEVDQSARDYAVGFRLSLSTSTPEATVEQLIAAIGDVAYTDESKAKIDAARAAYDALTPAQQALVGNYATLTAAEAAYAALVPAPCYEVIDESDITAPYAAPKAVTLLGAAYDGCDVVGIVELKLGKVNAKKKTSKVSGSVTTLDGKKHTIKGVTVAGIDGTAPAVVSLAVKDIGTLSVTIGGTQFAGTLGGTFHVQSASVGGTWAGGTATATVEINDGDLDKFPGTLLTTLLPDGETATVKNSKWTFAKAATVKWAKAKGAAEKSLIVDTSKGKTNLSGLKFTYTPKKGTFKGTFKVYALDGSGKTVKLNKYTFNVSGFVFDGVGYGKATCKKPAVSWSVTVE